MNRFKIAYEIIKDIGKLSIDIAETERHLNMLKVRRKELIYKLRILINI